MYTKHRLFLVCSLVFWGFLPVALFPQTSSSSRSSNAGEDDASAVAVFGILPNAQLALSSPDYRVTAGDVYTLSFMAGTQAAQYLIPVDTTYRIKIVNMGIVDAGGKTFPQLKTQVEEVVAYNYPLSGVQFVLTRPAVFKVHVKGEVQAAGEVNAWALTRLSSLAVEGSLTPFASLRDITVRSSGGQTRVYDLFKALRDGDLTQDPYLRPGDTVTFNRIVRSVSIGGAVERPGTYQLLEGENIKELIELYGRGFTPVADPTRIEIVRYVNSGNIAGDRIYLTLDDIAGDLALEDYDSVVVPEITVLSPVMFVEGAIGPGVVRTGGGITISEGSSVPEVSTRLVVPFHKGELYASLVRRNSNWFTAVSDTRNAYIIRGNEHIPVNLNIMLYDAEYRGEVRIEENDVLMVPFRQYFVNVAGAVAVPGRYPYIPDRTWDYYIALAGGFRPDQNARQSVTINDITGKKLDKTDVITPETTITAKTNSFHYYFNQYAPVITTTLTIITTFITIQTYLNTR
ncbi:MAG: SLBB domain-containing protein [Treponema sp.]|nr:SLBB domain-containing protein [Treponema sp.]